MGERLFVALQQGFGALGRASFTKLSSDCGTSTHRKEPLPFYPADPKPARASYGGCARARTPLVPQARLAHGILHHL
jgi:hypothetical protein